MDDLQESQVRNWAESLCGATTSDQRAMGKAMLMLLGQIDSLRAELKQQAAGREPPPTPEGQNHKPPPEPEADRASVEDTAAIRLRDRLRAATRRTAP